MRPSPQFSDEVQHLFSHYGNEPQVIVATLKNLFWYLGARSQTVSFLISYGYSWDAEIILRSFYETTAKILFICFADETEKLGLAEEFWNGLQSINDRKIARKAKFAEQIFDEGGVSASVFAALQDGRIFDLSTEDTKRQRKRLEQKWSFSEIIEYLDQKSHTGRPLKGIKSLVHIYGMASHLIHADSAALSLMHDRTRRKLEELKVVEAAHISRIMGDQVCISWFCVDALREHFRGDFANQTIMREALDRTFELCRPFQTAFDNSQKSFYVDYIREPAAHSEL